MKTFLIAILLLLIHPNLFASDARLLQCAESARKISLNYLERALVSGRASDAVQGYMQEMKKRLLNTVYKHSALPANAKTETSHQGIKMNPNTVYAFVMRKETKDADGWWGNGKYTIHIANNFWSVCKIDILKAASVMLHEAAHLTPNSSFFNTYFGECDADRLSSIVQVLATGKSYPGGYQYAGGPYEYYLDCSDKKLTSALVNFYKNPKDNVRIRIPIVTFTPNALTPEEEAWVQQIMTKERRETYTDPEYKTLDAQTRANIEWNLKEYELKLRKQVLENRR